MIGFAVGNEQTMKQETINCYSNRVVSMQGLWLVQAKPSTPAGCGENLRSEGMAHLYNHPSSRVEQLTPAYGDGSKDYLIQCVRGVSTMFTRIRDHAQWFLNCKVLDSEQAAAHQLQHALTGNGSKEEQKKSKKTRAPRSKEAKKKSRVGRTAQLQRQKEFIEEEAKGGNSKAKAFKNVIRGRGDYTMGREIGSKVGGWAGNKLEGFLRSVFGGSGDYDIQLAGESKPTANSLIAGSGVPGMHDNSAGQITVRHHEYIGTLAMTEDFTLTTFDIDVTNPNTFPWLSVIARNFQQYQINGLIFMVKSLSSDVAIAPTQGMGTISGSVRYDVESLPPTTSVEILGSVFSSSAKPSVNQAFPVECARAQTQTSILKVLQPGTTPNDLQFYKLGFLDIATEGAANSYPEACQVYCVYDITFMKPRVDTLSGGPMFFMDTNSTRLTPFAPIADTLAVKQPRVNTIGIGIQADHVSFVFPLNIQVGSLWYVDFCVTGDPTANMAPQTLLCGNGLVQANAFGDQSFALHSAPYSATNVGCLSVEVKGVFRYTGGATVNAPAYVSIATASGTLWPTNPIPGTLFVIKIDNNCASGLTSRPTPLYTRHQFFEFLCDMIAGRNSPSPPGDYRLVDWVHQFSKTTTWPVGKLLPKSPARFDVTLVDALTAISKYTGSIKLPEVVPNEDSGDSKALESELAVLKQQIADLKESSRGRGGWVAIDEQFGYPSVVNRPTEGPRRTREQSTHGTITEGDDMPVDDPNCKICGGTGFNADGGWCCVLDVVDKNPCLLLSEATEIARIALVLDKFMQVEVSVNPKGLTGSMEPVRKICSSRQASGWKAAGMSMTRTTVKNTWLWMCPMKLYSRVLLAEQPVDRWTIDKVRKVQCYCMTGSKCQHRVHDCPGLSEVICDSDALEQLDARERLVILGFLNGNAGSTTNSDDVKPEIPEFTTCDSGTTCSISGGSHVHKRKGDPNRKPFAGALKRFVEAQNKANAKASESKDKPRKPIEYTYCDIPYPFCTNPDHGHLYNDRTKFRVEEKADGAMTIFEIQHQPQNPPGFCKGCKSLTPYKELNFGLCEMCLVNFSGDHEAAIEWYEARGGPTPEVFVATQNPEAKTQVAETVLKSTRIGTIIKRGGGVIRGSKPGEGKTEYKEETLAISVAPVSAEKAEVELMEELGESKRERESKQHPRCLQCEAPCDKIGALCDPCAVRHKDDEIKQLGSKRPGNKQCVVCKMWVHPLEAFCVVCTKDMELRLLGVPPDEPKPIAGTAAVNESGVEQKIVDCEVDIIRDPIIVKSGLVAKRIKQIGPKFKFRSWMTDLMRVTPPSRNTLDMDFWDGTQWVAKRRVVEPRLYDYDSVEAKGAFWSIDTRVAAVDSTICAPGATCECRYPCSLVQEIRGRKRLRGKWSIPLRFADSDAQLKHFTRSLLSESEPVDPTYPFVEHVSLTVVSEVDCNTFWRAVGTVGSVASELGYAVGHDVAPYKEDGDECQMVMKYCNEDVIPKLSFFASSKRRIAKRQADDASSRLPPAKGLWIPPPELGESVDAWWYRTHSSDYTGICVVTNTEDEFKDVQLGEVLVYYTLDPRSAYTICQRIKEFVMDRTPFLQQSVGYELNESRGLTQQEAVFFESNGRKSYTWGFPWSANWLKPANYMQVAQHDFAYLGVSYYKSCSKVKIFDDLYKYMNDVSEKRVKDLHQCQFVRRTDKGECEIVGSTVAKSKSVALLYEDASKMFNLSPEYFCNTIHHFVQQSIARGLKDLSTYQPITGITFGGWGSR